MIKVEFIVEPIDAENVSYSIRVDGVDKITFNITKDQFSYMNQWLAAGVNERKVANMKFETCEEIKRESETKEV